jgi:hypothetical protein
VIISAGHVAVFEKVYQFVKAASLFPVGTYGLAKV